MNKTPRITESRYGDRRLFERWGLVAFGSVILSLGPLLQLARPYLHLVTGTICPFKNLTGQSCPFCGLTHALAHGFGGEFSLAWTWHPLWWLPAGFLLLLGITALADGWLGRNYLGRLATALSATAKYVAVGWALAYLGRLFP